MYEREELDALIDKALKSGQGSLMQGRFESSRPRDTTPALMAIADQLYLSNLLMLREGLTRTPTSEGN